MESSSLELTNQDYYVVFLSTRLINIFAIFSFDIILNYLKFSFIIKRVYINGHKVDFQGQLSEFFFLELKFRLYSLLTCGIYSLFISKQRIKKYMEFTYIEDNIYSTYEVSLLDNIKNILFLTFIGVLSLGIYLPYLLFKRKKFIVNHLKLSSYRLCLYLDDISYFKYLLKNILYIFLSCGIYLFFFLPEYKRFITRQIKIR